MRFPTKKYNNVSFSFDKCPAKTFLDRYDVPTLGRNVFDHCRIVGTVAHALTNQRQLKLPPGVEVLVALHDLGKISPTFYEKLRRAALPSPLIPLPDIDPSLESQWSGHAGTGLVAARDLLPHGYGPVIIGQHHGGYPKGCDSLFPTAEVLGGQPWQMERERLFHALCDFFGAAPPLIDSNSQALLIAGLTTVADWIGSGELFENPEIEWEGLIQTALGRAGFVTPALNTGKTFLDLFGFSPNAMQISFCEKVQGPGVYVLEAPMGLGKTEAALAAAYSLLQRGEANGIYFALPTQLTSNKIYERFTGFLDRILLPDDPHRALLLHSGAWLVDCEMGEEARPGYPWFDHARRGILAPFAVGTLDQALMAVMNVRHGAVRAFGLAGKVVILDEVHSYDSYTGTLLDTLVKSLRDWGATVLLLSATLDRKRREEFLGGAVSQTAYPLISSRSQVQEICETVVSPPPAQTTALRMCGSDDDALNEAVRRASLGEHVLWVENTVGGAQEYFRLLAARARPAGVDCGLLHSRFTGQDRHKAEATWVNIFGKQGYEARGSCGRILVGTQVVEQSIDIDADFLVSRFAPSDMLLQRMGRLWRHGQTPRPSQAQRQMWVLAPTLVEAIGEPESAFASTASVYSPYVLCRSLEVWETLQKVVLPDDVRSILEATYAARVEHGQMAQWLTELEDGVPQRRGRAERKGRKAMRQLARLTLAEGTPPLSDTDVVTRFSDRPMVDLWLVRGIRLRQARDASDVELLDGSRLSIPLRRSALSPAEWRELSVALMKQVVRIPVSAAPPPCSRSALEVYGLQHCFYLGSSQQTEAALRVGLVDDTGAVHSFGGINTAETMFYYDSEIGYRSALKSPQKGAVKKGNARA